MMYSEFTERTGFYPTAAHYRAIEEAYLKAGQDKDTFCAAYRENRDGMAIAIAHETDMAAFRQSERETRRVRHEREQMAQEIDRQAQQIRELEDRLERELEWEPKPLESAMDQAHYEKLAGGQGVTHLTDEEAVDLIAKEFGFDREKIGIVRQLNLYEVNRHRCRRPAGTVQRDPVFDAWDYNYIAFSVRGNTTMTYEMVDGELHLR